MENTKSDTGKNKRRNRNTKPIHSIVNGLQHSLFLLSHILTNYSIRYTACQFLQQEKLYLKGRHIFSHFVDRDAPDKFETFSEQCVFDVEIRLFCTIIKKRNFRTGSFLYVSTVYGPADCQAPTVHGRTLWHRPAEYDDPGRRLGGLPDLPLFP